MDHLLFEPRHWRDRAEEARAVAGQLSDATARAMMLEIAATYDRMARDAERRLAAKQSGKDKG
jgi:hypothetical protein